MNHRLVIGRLGILFVLLSAIMLATAAVFGLLESLNIRHDPDYSSILALCIVGVGGMTAGAIAGVLTRGSPGFLGRREALLLVALSWLLGAALAALPYWIWANLSPAHHDAAADPHRFLSFVDCYFEAMSGLTTTGATVLADIESLPSGLLLWRSITHWLGGLGIVVLFVAVLPGLGVGGKRLYNVEAPGPSKEGLQPHIRETARWLWYIYLGLTLVEVTALWSLTPMDLFDSICHTFGTMATGGFSTRNASVGAYGQAPLVDLIIVIFMVLAGMNFSLFYRMRRGRVREVFRDTELRVYLGFLLVGSLLVSLAVWWSGEPIRLTTGESVAASAGNALRQGVFTTVSIQTTTGFCTSDFDRWPFLAKAVLLVLMFVGGCSGSTGGGIKVIRIWVAFRILVAEIEHVFRPQVVRPMRLGRATMGAEQRLGTMAFVLGMILLFAIGSAVVMLLEQLHPESNCAYTTSATAVAATLFNVGPGLDLVGALQNYGWFSAPSKCVLSLLMVLGRLEMFAILVLLSPQFWRDR